VEDDMKELKSDIKAILAIINGCKHCKGGE
jgi:hypothetical protein